MTAREQTADLAGRLERRFGLLIATEDVNTLRRAQLTLRRWHELECGDGDDYKSWAIERDEDTDVPYMTIYPHNGPARRTKIADREKGAIKRIAAVCEKYRLHFYVQTDPRGCALYVSTEELTSASYTNGVACC